MTVWFTMLTSWVYWSLSVVRKCMSHWTESFKWIQCVTRGLYCDELGQLGQCGRRLNVIYVRALMRGTVMWFDYDNMYNELMNCLQEIQCR